MATAQGIWMRSLSTDKKLAIRDLHQLNPWWNLVSLLFVGLWIAAAAIMIQFPSWYVRVPGYLFIGILIHGLGNFMHEAIHGNLFRNRRWDRWFGFLCGLPTLFQITGYRVSHLLHHRHTRTEDDPDSMMNVSSNKTFLSIFFYIAGLIGVFLYHARLPFVVWTKGSRKEVWQLVFETVITLSVVTGVFYFAWQYECLGVVLHCWVFPLLSAALIANIRGAWAEHELTEAGHPLTQTRTVTSNPIYSFFNINFELHIEHHLYPAIPWYNLPALHRLCCPSTKRPVPPFTARTLRLCWMRFESEFTAKAPLDKKS